MNDNDEMRRMIAGILGNDREKVVIPRLYLTVCGGDYVKAMVLKEIAFWSGVWANDDERQGWWYRNAHGWQKEVFLSHKQLIRAITNINKMAPGLIARRVRKVGGTRCMFFRVVPEVFVLLVKPYTDQVFVDTKSPDGNDGANLPNGDLHANRPNGDLQIAQTAISLQSPVTVPPISSINHSLPDSNESGPTAPKPKTTPARKYDHQRIVNDPLFVSFWNAYPRHIEKQDATKAWFKINPDTDLVATILTALKWQVLQPGWLKDDGQFIPHPATWLNKNKWEDERPTANGNGHGDQVIYGTDAMDEMQRQLGDAPLVRSGPVSPLADPNSRRNVPPPTNDRRDAP